MTLLLGTIWLFGCLALGFVNIQWQILRRVIGCFIYFRVKLLGPIFASLLDLCLENVLFGFYFLLPTAPQPQPNIPASEIGCK